MNVSTHYSDRRIRNLRLRLTERDDIHRASTLVEDAFRTASFPQVGEGRLLLIRRLDLGRILRHSSPATLSLQLEHAARRIGSMAVAIDSPAASAANAVLVADCAGALVRLARMYAKGDPSTEWFWRKLVPRWCPNAERAENWRCLLAAAHDLPGAAIAAAAVVNQVVEWRKGAELLDAVTPIQAREWMSAAGFDFRCPQASLPEIPALRPGDRTRTIVEDLRTHFPADDRLVWLGTLLAIHELPSRVFDSKLPFRVNRLFVEMAPSTDAAHDDRRRFGVRYRDPHSRSTTANDNDQGAEKIQSPLSVQRLETEITLSGSRNSGDEHHEDSGDIPSTEVRRPDESKLFRESRPSDREVESNTVLSSKESGNAISRTHINQDSGGKGSDLWKGEESPATGVSTHREFTSCAGLLFLVPVLERLGVVEWLRAHPSLIDAAFPARLLQFTGERLGMQADDALWAELEEIGCQEPLPEVKAWPETVRALLEKPRPRCTLDTLLDVWLTAMRRWCRRNVRMGLFSIVRRPGRLLITRTHLEVCFDLSQIDLHLRRNALDVDPGWVPWLGRVIRFHYLDPDEWYS